MPEIEDLISFWKFIRMSRLNADQFIAQIMIIKSFSLNHFPLGHAVKKKIYQKKAVPIAREGKKKEEYKIL